MKGGVILSATGYIQVHAYTSRAKIPIKDAAITVTDNSGNAIAMRLTNRNGMLDTPIPISTPDLSAGQQPNTGQIPFTVVNIFARAENFEEIDAENVQVFPGIITDQDLELIPLSEFPESWNKIEVFDTPPQNL